MLLYQFRYADNYVGQISRAHFERVVSVTCTTARKTQLELQLDEMPGLGPLVSVYDGHVAYTIVRILFEMAYEVLVV